MVHIQHVPSCLRSDQNRYLCDSIELAYLVRHCLTMTIDQRNGIDASNVMIAGDADTLSLAARLEGVAAMSSEWGGKHA